MTTAYRTDDYLTGLVHELRGHKQETEWVEFKINNEKPEEIGEYISALSNSAALAGKAFGYLVWGVDNGSHDLEGTKFRPRNTKVGNEEIENWLLRLMTPKIHFSFFEVEIEGHHIVILEIERATRHPVSFQGKEYIRIGSYKRPLKDNPEKERALWRIFDRVPFESVICAERVNIDQVLQLLDYPSYFELAERPLPPNKEAISKALADDGLIIPCEAGGWSITNLGGILFAKQMKDFRSLQRKAVRVIQYRGDDKTETIREQVGSKGYASGFSGLISYINNLLPTNEVVEQALRRVVPMFPELAVRELVANALIHQDLHIAGASPMIEIFSDRIEISNPGEPLIDIQRLMDTPPRSRNEVLASLMRRFRICEERGSGIDKVVSQVELYQLPAPLFETVGGFTRSVLFSHRPLSDMDKADRIRACYLHACLRYVTRKPMTNASVRQRFGIPEKNSAAASRLLNEAVEAGVIHIEDPTVGTRIRRYLPYWAEAPARGNGMA